MGFERDVEARARAIRAKRQQQQDDADRIASQQRAAEQRAREDQAARREEAVRGTLEHLRATLEYLGAEQVLRQAQVAWKTGTIERYEDTRKLKVGIRLVHQYPIAVDTGSQPYHEGELDFHGSVSPADWHVGRRETSLSIEARRSISTSTTYITVQDSAVGGREVDPYDVDDEGPTAVYNAAIELTAQRIADNSLPLQLEAEARQEIYTHVHWFRRMREM